MRIRWTAILICLLLGARAYGFGIEKGPCVLFETAYGQALANSEAACVWWTFWGWKVDRNRPAPRQKGGALEISAARNEAEPAQLVVLPKRELENFRFVCSDLAGGDGAVIPKSAISVRRVGYVHITWPTDRAGAEGWWPDPLYPIEGPLTLEAGKNQPFWVLVHVPAGAAAGTYEGEIILEAEGFSATVPLRVEVYDFALPEVMSLSTAFGIKAEDIFLYHNVKEPEKQRELLDTYWASFDTHHISPYYPAPLDPWKVEWVTLDAETAAQAAKTEEDRRLLVEKALTPVFDWSAWDRELTRVMETFGFNTIRLRPDGLRGHPPEIAGFKEGTREYELAVAAYLGELNRHFKDMGWTEEAYVYWFDEPTPREYDYVMNGFNKLKEHAPDLRRFLTEHVEPELIGGPEIWCPLPRTYQPELADERRAAGDHFWWYICTGPKAPYFGLFTDHPATDLRVWLWLTWRHDFEGILIWHVNKWHSNTAYPDSLQDPLADPMTWKSGYGLEPGMKGPFGNGDGRFFYPPPGAAGTQEEAVMDAPLESLRWEILRDGIEDHEYLVMLERLLEERGAGLSWWKRRSYRKLLDVPDSIAESMTVYTKDPAPINKRRGEVARAIEALLRMR